MTVGLATGAVLSHRAGYRLGGVMVLPLLAIYTFREPLSPIIFVVGAVTAWGALWGIREFTLNHGRRVFLIAIFTGACGTVLAGYAMDAFTLARLSFDDAEIVASIFPGIAAYNVMRLDREDRPVDVVAMVAAFAGLLLLGAGVLVFFQGRAFPTPPVLTSPSSDILRWLGAEPSGGAMTPVTPNWLSLSLLVVDVVVYEWIRKRYDLRLVGIIVVPLLAVFSVRLEYTAAIFAIGVTAVFTLLTVIHWVSLLYGRVLLACSLVCGSLYALAIGVVIPYEVPGTLLFFVGLFVGIASYNLYYVSPSLRSASLRISVGLFVVFYAVLALVVDIPPRGLFHDGEVGYVVLGAVAVAFAVVELSRLERSRPPRAEFARASVFASVDIDGADAEDSPLVDTPRRSWVASIYDSLPLDRATSGGGECDRERARPDSDEGG